MTAKGNLQTLMCPSLLLELQVKNSVRDMARTLWWPRKYKQTSDNNNNNNYNIFQPDTVEIVEIDCRELWCLPPLRSNILIELWCDRVHEPEPKRPTCCTDRCISFEIPDMKLMCIHVFITIDFFPHTQILQVVICCWQGYIICEADRTGIFVSTSKSILIKYFIKFSILLLILLPLLLLLKIIWNIKHAEL